MGSDNTCPYCGNHISLDDDPQFVAEQPLHQHCYLLLGAESLGLTLDEFTTNELDALNLHLSENAEQPEEGTNNV